jgi:hypothetical protein
LRTSSLFRGLAVIAVLALVCARLPFAFAYIEAPQSLGSVCQQSTNIMVCVVEKVDKEKNLIIYRKLEDLKGKHPTDIIRHNIGRGGYNPREWQYSMEWAEVGKTAIFFHNGGAGEMCLGGYWYQIYPGGDWWNMSHGEPFLLRSFAGKIEKLIPIVKDIVSGKDTIAPCMVDGNKDDLHMKRARIQRLKVSLKLLDYNPQRDFAGWGGEDIRALRGMPGFSHTGALSRVDPEAQAVSVVDFDGDGKPDLCLVGAGKVVLLQNGGDAFSEITLPGVTGCRSAVWADYNGDGKPDLLLATATGPKLFTNLGGGAFRDDSALLPSEPNWNLTAAAWIDYDGDGRPDILLANGYNGLRLYRNDPPKDLAQKMTPPKLGPWHVIGPFDDKGRKGFATVYPPEKEINFAAEYEGKNKEKIRWQNATLTDGSVQDLKPFFKQHDESCCYLYREIESAANIELPSSFGSDDTITVWLNGEKLISENVDRAAGPDQNLATLKLKPGKNALLIKICNGNGEWAYYFKAGDPKVGAARWFVDVSKQVGLGPDGIAGRLKGDTLAVCDIDCDGRPDFLFGAGTGVLVLNKPQGFVEAVNSGISYKTGKVGPIFVDLNHDGRPDLFVPQDGVCKLFRNDGDAHFTDITATTGDLAKPIGQAVCAAWGDFDNDGNIDLFVGCLRGPNRYFRNRGDGTFADMSEEIGLTQKRFNTQAIALVDLNNDGMLDVVFVNEGQESCLMFGNPAFANNAKKRTSVTVQLGKALSAVGGKATVKGSDGKLISVQHVSGGDGRGGQVANTPRFTLLPGNYKVEVRDSKGEVREKDLVVTEQNMKVLIE